MFAEMIIEETAQVGLLFPLIALAAGILVVSGIIVLIVWLALPGRNRSEE